MNLRLEGGEGTIRSRRRKEKGGGRKGAKRWEFILYFIEAVVFMGTKAGSTSAPYLK